MNGSKLIKEACVGSYQEALHAYHQGASRIELCADLSVGGVTPSLGTIYQTVRTIPLPIFVLIRPRGGNFYFTDDEFEIMRQDIMMCQKLGVHGVVIGALTQDNQLDNRITLLLNAAKDLNKTFHKAFDEADDKKQLLEQLIALKFDRILSSGSALSVFDGIPTLNDLIAQTKQRITIVACGGITHTNLDAVTKALDTHEFHGKLIVGPLN